MAEQSPRAVLNDLMETCRDSERGYRAAADLVASQALNVQFREIAAERARFAEALLPYAQRLGGDEASDGTTAATLHRRWMDLKARLTHHDDQAVFAEVIRGDTVTLRTYETALGA
ncbi:MAG TPA: PA2169 family four-helix-bundle protein, partial [Vicinamibacterales bacterium]|nr:PA2169 family four-helix-bundle protein [Vicinamibacterales bacterium]